MSEGTRFEKKKGSRWPVPVAAALIEKDGRVLIAKRKAGRFTGKWEFPGGKVEEDETPEECLKRELREELAIETQIGTLYLSTTYAYPHATIELLTYRASIVSGEIELREHSDARWVAPEELQNYDFPEADCAVIERLARDVRPG